MYKLLFIENPHDSKSADIKQGIIDAGLQDETHTIPFDAIQGLPIQAAPCVFLIGTSDLQEAFTALDVVNRLEFLKSQKTTEERLDYLGKISVRARLAGIK